MMVGLLASNDVLLAAIVTGRDLTVPSVSPRAELLGVVAGVVGLRRMLWGIEGLDALRVERRVSAFGG